MNGGTATKMPEVGPDRELAHQRVLVVGLEPWGTVAAADLAAAGVGALHALDDARVTAEDVSAVRFFTDADVGAKRVEALASALSTLTPSCEVTTGPLHVAVNEPLHLEDFRWDLVLTCVPADDLIALQGVARFAQEAGLVSLSAHLDARDAVIGPAVTPGRSACWRCARLRQLAASPEPRVEQALETALLAGRAARRARVYPAVMPGALGHALALAALELLASPETAPSVGALLVLDLLDLSTTRHPVLREPWCDVCGGARASLGDGAIPEASGLRLDTTADPQELRRRLAGIVDARTGIVKQLVLGTQDSPHALDLPITAAALLGAYSPCTYHDHPSEAEDGYGRGLTVCEALIGAVGEAVERYAAGRFDRSDLVRASAREMTGDLLVPEQLCPYGEAQYAEPGFPFSPVAETTPIDWVLGRWLDTREPVYVPALPTYYNYPAPPGERFCQVTSNGLAAGATLDEAAMRAATELIERDAFMISWLTRRPGRRIQLDASIDPEVREIARQLGARAGRLELYLLDAGLHVPAVLCAAFGDGRRWPGATVSLASHLSPRVAIAKAILEQGQGGPYLRRLMEEKKHPVPARPQDVRTLTDHALYYIPEERARAFAFLDRGDVVRAADLPEPEACSLDVLGRRVGAAGLRIALVDVTSPDLAPTPFRVVRALGAGFQQIHFNHRLARLGNPRLRALAADGLNPDPHPMD